MSPSQRATLGEEAPNPPERSLSYSASSALSIPRSSPPREKPIPSPSPFPVPPLLPSASPPNTRRQRLRRSFSSIAIELHPQNLCQYRQHQVRTLLVDVRMIVCKCYSTWHSCACPCR